MWPANKYIPSGFCSHCCVPSDTLRLSSEEEEEEEVGVDESEAAVSFVKKKRELVGDISTVQYIKMWLL